MTRATPPISGPWSRVLLPLLLAVLLGGCAVPSAPKTKTVYDLGIPAAQTSTTSATHAPLVLGEMDTTWDQNSTAMQYRLAYANGQELLPYALARWSMPPAQLVAQRVRSVLGQQRPVVPEVDRSTVFELQLGLESFEQTFDAPQKSRGTVRLRATLYKSGELLGQREFVASKPAPTSDAAGGARALSDATQTAATELSTWLAVRMR